MFDSYKFVPDDFKDILGLSEELSQFYTCFEIYKNDNSLSNRFSFEKQGRHLFFTIKHRELEGWITHGTATEMREYAEELLNA